MSRFGPKPKASTERDESMSQDQIVRAMTNDGAFRCMAVRGTETVNRILAAQQSEPATQRALGELVLGAVLYRETMAPDLRVQCIVKGAGKTGSLLADAHPSGMTRGLYQPGRDGPFTLDGEGAILQMTRNLPRGNQHQGLIDASNVTLERAIMSYFEQSEQVSTMIGVGLPIADNQEAVVASAYLVQLLPEVKDAHDKLAVLTERLAHDFADMDAIARETDGDPKALIEEIFYGMEFTYLSDSPLFFGCTCSEERIQASLLSLQRSELMSLIDDGEPVDMSCDYCGSEYHVGVDQLRALLTTKGEA